MEVLIAASARLNFVSQRFLRQILYRRAVLKRVNLPERNPGRSIARLSRAVVFEEAEEELLARIYFLQKRRRSAAEQCTARPPSSD
nr:hypothetical protein [uncultured Campylobacter sp.]